MIQANFDEAFIARLKRDYEAAAEIEWRFMEAFTEVVRQWSQAAVERHANKGTIKGVHRKGKKL